MIIFMDPPEHRNMRSLLNKVFTPRAIQAQSDNVIDKIEKYLGRIEGDEFDAVQEFTAPFPVEVITAMLGVPEEDAQQVRHWIDDSLTREVGQVEVGEQAMQANIDQAMFYFDLVAKRRADPGDDLFSKLVQAELERENGEMDKLDDLEIAAFASLLGGAGAETVTKLVGNAVYMFAKNPGPMAEAAGGPQQDPGRGRGVAALRGAVAVPGAPFDERRSSARLDDSRGQPGVPDRRLGEPRRAGVDGRRQV